MRIIARLISTVKVGFTGTLQRYILTSFLVAASLTGLVLTFILSVGFLFQVFQFIIQGASADLVLQYLAASLPEVLGFTIPLALMVASLLVFGRLSTDSEIAAMKACGVSFPAIMRGPIIIAILCAAIGFYLQNYAMPSGHYVRRTIATRLALDSGVNLIEPGRFINDIDNVAIFCDRKVDIEKDGKKVTQLYDLLAIDSRSGFLREIEAEKADMHLEGSDIVFVLYNGTFSPSMDDGGSGIGKFEQYPIRIKDAITRTKKYTKKPKDFTFNELLAAERAAKFKLDEVVAAKAAGKEQEGLSVKGASKWHSRLRFLLHYRTVWALSAFCFVLVGIPLGCQSQRKDSARGMSLGIAIGIAFFLFILLSESLADKPSAYPWVLVWTPVILCIGAALHLIKKHQ